MNFTGGLLGLLCFAPLASWRGRRFAFAVYHLGAAIVRTGGVSGRGHVRSGALVTPLDGLFRPGNARRLCDLLSRALSHTVACDRLERVFQPGPRTRGRHPDRSRYAGHRWGCGAVVVLSGLFWVGLVILLFRRRLGGRSCRSEWSYRSDGATGNSRIRNGGLSGNVRHINGSDTL